MAPCLTVTIWYASLLYRYSYSTWSSACLLPTVLHTCACFGKPLLHKEGWRWPSHQVLHPFQDGPFNFIQQHTSASKCQIFKMLLPSSLSYQTTSRWWMVCFCIHPSTIHTFSVKVWIAGCSNNISNGYKEIWYPCTVSIVCMWKHGEHTTMEFCN